MSFRKFLYIVFSLLIIKAQAEIFEVNDFDELTAALNSAQIKSGENHIINVNGDILFSSNLSENLNLEFVGSDSTNLINFNLNDYTLTFNGSNKNARISNLNILANPNGGITSSNGNLTIESSVLNGNGAFGKELVKNSSGNLKIISSKFLNNNAQKGAGINFSGSELNILNSNFSNNKSAYGAGVYLNNGKNIITNSNFKNNTSTSGAGAIYQEEKSTLTLDNTEFNGNEVSTASTGGAIINKGTLYIKNGSKFLNNKVEQGSAGAISNSGTLNIDNALFENNKSKNDGGAISDTGSSIIKNSIFRKNQSTAYYGGAITSIRDIEIDNCTFEENSSYSFGGAIATMRGNAKISNSNFIKNSSKTNFGGGAIINYLGDLTLSGNNLFEENSSSTKGGAITSTTNSTTNIYSGTKFINNKADDLGGAIFSQGTVNIFANEKDNPVIFSGNTDKNGSNAIHLDIYQNTPVGVGELNVEVQNGSSVVFEDNLSGVENTSVNLNGSSSYNDKIYFGANNENLKSTVNTNNISLEFYNPLSGMDNAVINSQNTHFNFMNGVITKNNLNLNLIGDDNSFSIDVDPLNLTSDYFILSNNRSNMANITLRDINVLSEPTESTTIFDIFDHERYGTNLTLSEDLKNKTVYGAIKKYIWQLTPKLTLIETSGFNPNIQRYQSASASAFFNQMLSYDYSFNRTDEIYSSLREKLLSERKLNSYAYNGRGGKYLEHYFQDGSAFWIRPYVNLETFHLSGNVSSVNNQSYGTIFGTDYPMYETKNDWKLFSTIYGAYIGSKQEYSESDMYQNGGYLGYLLSAFKDDFYLAWTINGGGLGIVSRYLKGKDDYGIITAGTALKFGYNYKFKNFIIQPNFTTAYTYLNPTNLVNFQNIDLNQSQVNGLTIAPSVRLTYRNESGFEPYIFAGCTIPVMNEIKLKADNVYLDKLRLNTWAQFGAGIRKKINERITCFLESIIRTGGRAGWGLMFNIEISI